MLMWILSNGSCPGARRAGGAGGGGEEGEKGGAGAGAGAGAVRGAGLRGISCETSSSFCILLPVCLMD